MTTKRSANSSWLAHEGISALFTASERSTLAIELIHRHSWESGSSMMLSLVLVDFVNWLGGVYNGRLNGVLLDDGLDVLVNVVVNVLACDGWLSTGAVLSLALCASVPELSLLSSETFLDVRIVTVLDAAFLNRFLVVFVFFWEDLAVLNGLNGGVVVILVNFTVYCLSDILALGASDILVLDCRIDGLVNGSFVLSIPGEEVSNGCLSFIHFE